MLPHVHRCGCSCRIRPRAGRRRNVFSTNDQGETFVVKAGKKFELLRVNRMNERMLASPAIVDGTDTSARIGHLMAVGK